MKVIYCIHSKNGQVWKKEEIIELDDIKSYNENDWTRFDNFLNKTDFWKHNDLSIEIFDLDGNLIHVTKRS